VRNGLAEHCVVLAYRMSIVGRKSGASQRSTLNTRVSVGRMMKTYNAAHPHARVSPETVMNAKRAPKEKV
jgi:hypothetical protein